MYIASLHSNNETSKTFKLIDKYLKDGEEVDLLILEGFNHSLGASPMSMVTWANNQGRDGFYEGYETAYAIKVASTKKKIFWGAEPDVEFIIEEAKKYGFGCRDVLFYFFVQQVFQNKENGVLEGKSIKDFFNSFLQDHLIYFKTVPELTDFLSWFQIKNKFEFKLEDIDEEVPAPNFRGELYTQRVSSAICIIRDRFICTVIADKMNEQKNVLAIFGGSHWSTQRLSLIHI